MHFIKSIQVLMGASLLATNLAAPSFPTKNTLLEDRGVEDVKPFQGFESLEDESAFHAERELIRKQWFGNEPKETCNAEGVCTTDVAKALQSRRFYWKYENIFAFVRDIENYIPPICGNPCVYPTTTRLKRADSCNSNSCDTQTFMTGAFGQQQSLCDKGFTACRKANTRWALIIRRTNDPHSCKTVSEIPGVNLSGTSNWYGALYDQGAGGRIGHCWVHRQRWEEDWDRICSLQGTRWSVHPTSVVWCAWN